VKPQKLTSDYTNLTTDTKSSHSHEKNQAYWVFPNCWIFQIPTVFSESVRKETTS